MAKTKPETDVTPTTSSSAAAVAVRGISYAPPAEPGAPAAAEIRVEPGEAIPAGVPQAVVEALIAEGAARR